MLHDMSPWYSERSYLLPWQEIPKLPSIYPGQNYAMVLCNNFMGILFCKCAVLRKDHVV